MINLHLKDNTVLVITIIIEIFTLVTKIQVKRLQCNSSKIGEARQCWVELCGYRRSTAGTKALD